MEFDINRYNQYNVMLIATDEEGDIFDAYLKSKGIKIRGCKSIRDLRRIRHNPCINFNAGTYGSAGYYRAKGCRILHMRDFEGWEKYETVLDWDSTALDDCLSLFSCIS